MSDKTYVAELPPCDICKYEGSTVETLATHDAKTSNGRWAFVCLAHFNREGCSVGTGHGQRLIVGDEPEVDPATKRADLMAAIEAGDFNAAEDIIGDGDLMEWL